MLKKKSIRLLIGYMICGTITTILDIGLLYLLTEFFNIWYFTSSFISYSIAIFVNFILNKNFNFKNKSKKVFLQFSIFFLIALVGLAINQLILYSFVEFFGIWYLSAKLLATLTVIMFNFFMQKHFTFGLLT